MKFLDIKGKPIQDNDNTVIIDNICQKFTVVIRSSAGVSAERIKDLIQQKFEVVSIDEDASSVTAIVR